MPLRLLLGVVIGIIIWFVVLKGGAPSPAGCQTESDWHDQPDLSCLSGRNKSGTFYLDVVSNNRDGDTESLY